MIPGLRICEHTRQFRQIVPWPEAALPSDLVRELQLLEVVRKGSTGVKMDRLAPSRNVDLIYQIPEGRGWFLAELQLGNHSTSR